MINRTTPQGEPIAAPQFAMPTDAEQMQAAHAFANAARMSLHDVLLCAHNAGVLIIPNTVLVMENGR